MNPNGTAGVAEAPRYQSSGRSPVSTPCTGCAAGAAVRAPALPPVFRRVRVAAISHRLCTKSGAAKEEKIRYKYKYKRGTIGGYSQRCTVKDVAGTLAEDTQSLIQAKQLFLYFFGDCRVLMA